MGSTGSYPCGAVGRASPCVAHGLRSVMADVSVTCCPPLSRRLAAVAGLVPAGLPVADIGTDHGLLPVWLVGSGRVPRAIAIDDKAAPLARARALVEARRVAVEVRQGWGCTPLAAGEVATLTLAGIGGPLVARILAGAPAGIGRVVVQPNVAEEGLRRWFHTHGWWIDAEHLVHDAGRWFQTFSAVPGGADRPTPDAAELAWGRVDAHLDRVALARRLDDDVRRLTDVSVRSPAAAQAVAHDLRIIAEVRRRLG